MAEAPFLPPWQVARNRLGLNDAIHEAAKADAEKGRLKKEKGAAKKSE